MEPWLFLGLALALGVKHAFDADHLLAVSNLLGRAPTRRRTVTMSAAWAGGHMLTAGLLTVALFLLRDTLLAAWLAHLELAVAAMLVLLGAAALALELRLVHRHRHAHGGVEHEHHHMHVGRHHHGAMLGIGVVHGVASNDEMLLLLAAGLGVTSLGGLLAGVGVFSVGVVAGMVAFGLALTAPLLRPRAARVRRAVNMAAALLSLGYGLALFAGFPGWNPLAALGPG